MRFYFLLLLAFLLSSCANTVSQAPSISKAELTAEQQAQKAIIEHEKQRAKTISEGHNLTEMQARLQAVGKKVHVAGQQVCADMAIADCEYPFVLDPEGKEVNAYTDGKKIVITPAMMQFAYVDTQLATVLYHEFAHAIMSHPSKTQQNVAIGSILGIAVDTLARTQGFDTGGTFSKIGAHGAVMRYSQGFEREADYIGMYVLDRAGYDVSQAGTLWRRMAALNPDGIYTGTTHPTTAERYLLLNKTADEINAKKQQGLAVLPEQKAPDKSFF